MNQNPAEPASILDPVDVSSAEKSVNHQTTNMPEIKQIKPGSGTKYRGKKLLKIASIGVGVAVLIVLVMVVVVVLPVKNVYEKAMVLAAYKQRLSEVVAKQDLGEIKTQLSSIRVDFANFDSAYKGISWMRSLPFVGPYVSDGSALIKAGYSGLDAADITLETITPYADFLGFGGSNNVGDGQKTAADRVDFVINTISKMTPQIEKIGEKVTSIKQDIATIDPGRYPETLRGVAIRENVAKLKQLVDEGERVIRTGKPLIEQAPYLLGVDNPRTYLVLFQNDKELRPTGGFLTGYAIVSVTKGKFQPTQSDDIYILDAKYTPTIAAPDPIVKYLKGPYVLNKNLRLRDMNFDPDFKESMNMFVTESKKAGMKTIDGIIAVDTHVLVNILNVLGEVGVGGYGNFNTKIDPECDCPQVVHELEKYADVEGAVVWSENEPGKIVFAPKGYGTDRKGIIGPLMNSVLANALGQPKDKLPALFEAAYKSVMEKHVLFYLLSDTAQKAVEDFGIAGRIVDADGDYLHVSDSNLGGRKSNLYVSNEIDQQVSIDSSGKVTKTLTLTYKNSRDYDGWLNSVLPNWTRIYVPKGSTLVSVEGFEDKGTTYEEHGKTVFSGGFQLRPNGVAKITLKYELPTKVAGDYKLYVQKQPGLDSILMTIDVNGDKVEEYLRQDTQYTF